MKGGTNGAIIGLLQQIDYCTLRADRETGPATGKGEATRAYVMGPNVNKIHASSRNIARKRDLSGSERKSPRTAYPKCRVAK